MCLFPRPLDSPSSTSYFVLFCSLLQPEGVERSYTEPVMVDLSDVNPFEKIFTFALPTEADGLVPGSVRGVLTATG